MTSYIASTSCRGIRDCSSSLPSAGTPTTSSTSTDPPSPPPAPTSSSSNPSSSSAIVSSSSNPSSSSAIVSSSSNPSPSSTAVLAVATTKPPAGAIAGGVIGGVVFLACIILGVLVYLRARRRRRTAPSSEFMNSLQPGAAPVLRLDSGATYAPVLSEKGGFTHYPSVPSDPPLPQVSYYPNSPTPDMKFPDAMMMTDLPSSRPSIEKPLHPQRFSAQHPNDSFADHTQPLSTSVGSRRELWGGDIELYPRSLSPIRRSPSREPDLPQSTTRYLNEPSSQHSYSSLWQPSTPQEPGPLETAGSRQPPHVRPPSSLQPLRRQQDSDGT